MEATAAACWAFGCEPSLSLLGDSCAAGRNNDGFLPTKSLFTIVGYPMMGGSLEAGRMKKSSWKVSSPPFSVHIHIFKLALLHRMHVSPRGLHIVILLPFSWLAAWAIRPSVVEAPTVLTCAPVSIKTEVCTQGRERSTVECIVAVRVGSSWVIKSDPVGSSATVMSRA